MRFAWLILCSFQLGAAALPWYMQETAMSPAGRLTFLDKPWWPRAQKLAEGESFTLDLNRDGRPDTLIERRDGNILEIIDDSGKAADLAHNRGSAAYVVSLKGTGLVDRMVVYIDNDGDGKADETEFRNYQDGYLRYCWFTENRDRDGADVFILNKDWNYVGGNDFRNKFRGNVEIFLNKFDPKTNTWVPLSECPFIFWDTNHDGHSDAVLRVSAAPLTSNQGKDTDYANHYSYALAPEATPLRDIGNMNVRFSFNLDPLPRREPVDQPHFTFGFNMVGAQPYSYPRMFYTNPRRRPPQTVVRIPTDEGMAVGLHYPAQQTGFTWDEARAVFRWEGQFWIYERVLMPNSGGPTMRWNMRREYSPKPFKERRLYYSDADKRYHLFGATEGWLEAGHLVNQEKDLEFRYFDSNGDGYLDTTQVFEGSNPVPVRVSRLTHVPARFVALDRETLQREYNTRVLPEAIAGDEKIIAVLKRAVEDPKAAAYEAQAAKAESQERRRYCLDISRELYFLRARDLFYTKTSAGPYPRLDQPKNKTRAGFTLADSLAYWKSASLIEDFVQAYGDGNLTKAAAAAEQIENLLAAP